MGRLAASFGSGPSATRRHALLCLPLPGAMPDATPCCACRCRTAGLLGRPNTRAHTSMHTGHNRAARVYLCITYFPYAFACACSVGPGGEGDLGGLHPCFPFVPLLKARHVVGLAYTQVPYEPTIPNQNTTHSTLTSYGMFAWLSTWQVRVQ